MILNISAPMEMLVAMSEISKRSKTNISRYGNACPANGGSAREKCKQTLKANYGVDNPMKNMKIQHKVTKTWIDKSYRKFADDNCEPVHIPVSELEIYRLDNSVANRWLDKYHPEGSGKGAILCFGLVMDSEIFCVMTFRKPINKRYTTQLLRMWMKPGYYVDDGYDTLSRYASGFGLYNIVAYANPRYEDIEEYEKIGMSLVRLRNGKVIFEYLTNR